MNSDNLPAPLTNIAARPADWIRLEDLLESQGHACLTMLAAWGAEPAQKEHGPRNPELWRIAHDRWLASGGPSGYAIIERYLDDLDAPDFDEDKPTMLRVALVELYGAFRGRAPSDAFIDQLSRDILAIESGSISWLCVASAFRRLRYTLDTAPSIKIVLAALKRQSARWDAWLDAHGEIKFFIDQAPALAQKKALELAVPF